MLDFRIHLIIKNINDINVPNIWFQSILRIMEYFLYGNNSVALETNEVFLNLLGEDVLAGNWKFFYLLKVF